MFANFGDFSYYRMEIARAHLVAGFGRIVDLKPQDVLTDISDAQPLTDSEADAIAHLHADHADACRLYATKLLGAPDGEWRCVGIDPDGIELQSGRLALRLPFPQRVNAPGPLRAILKQLADQARAR
jgi:putative heme iron utilization protein